MKISQAKKIAHSGITAGQLKATLKAAYTAGAANDQRSVVNKGMSKATVYNVMVRGYHDDDDNKIIEGAHCISAKNILREFGEFWEGEVPQPIKRNTGSTDYHHEEAIKCPF